MTNFPQHHYAIFSCSHQIFSSRTNAEMICSPNVEVFSVHYDRSLQSSKYDKFSSLKRKDKAFFLPNFCLGHCDNFVIKFELATTVVFTAKLLDIFLIFMSSKSYNWISWVPVHSTSVLYLFFHYAFWFNPVL